ncbi:MAG: hypothetical protein IJN40_05110 [Clostridia bacterium]|nr:hypothetical protein [Clostridia bacterium]
MKKIIKKLKSLIKKSIIAVITLVIGVILGNVLAEIWDLIFVSLMKKDAYFLASIVLWFPGILLGGVVGFMTYEHKKIKRRKEFYKFLNEAEKLECEIAKESVNSEQIQE